MTGIIGNGGDNNNDLPRTIAAADNCGNDSSIGTRTALPSKSNAIVLADPLTRRTQTASITVSSSTSTSATTFSSSSTLGRGCLAGWTLCSLCGDISKKKYSLGRGIANHLIDVHTPWNPSKLAQKIHRRTYEAEERKQNTKRCRKRRRLAPTEDDNLRGVVDNVETTSEVVSIIPFHPLQRWEPSFEERIAWRAKMIEILTVLESVASSVDCTEHQKNLPLYSAHPVTVVDHGHPELTRGDKNGRPVASYRDSLPPFLQAAAQGDLQTLQDLIQQAKNVGIDDGLLWTRSPISVKRVNELLDTKDRHNSTAEHWAAGGGHLKCLRYLYELRAEILDLTTSSDNNRVEEQVNSKQIIENTKKPNKIRSVRRRDGKTCLHYAARNGHIDCIRYLLTELDEHQRHTVDERSGEGTTSLHLACYGGHPQAVRDLVTIYGANVRATNDWGCSCAHWIGMTISTVDEDVREVCNYLRWQCELSFVERQKQGHSTLHKAALRKNKHVIQWLADRTKLDDTTKGCSDPDAPDCPYSKMDGAGLSSFEKEQAGAPDEGGHRPSDIWTKMGGDIDFANWMKKTMKW